MIGFRILFIPAEVHCRRCLTMTFLNVKGLVMNLLILIIFHVGIFNYQETVCIFLSYFTYLTQQQCMMEQSLNL